MATATIRLARRTKYPGTRYFVVWVTYESNSSFRYVRVGFVGADAFAGRPAGPEPGKSGFLRLLFLDGCPRSSTTYRLDLDAITAAYATTGSSR